MPQHACGLQGCPKDECSRQSRKLKPQNDRGVQDGYKKSRKLLPFAPDTPVQYVLAQASALRS